MLKPLAKKKLKKTANKLIDTPKILENTEYDFENIGTIDEAFGYLKNEYRKIFYKHYKTR